MFDNSKNVGCIFIHTLGKYVSLEQEEMTQRSGSACVFVGYESQNSRGMNMLEGG